jgi:hypothetical protein
MAVAAREAAHLQNPQRAELVLCNAHFDVEADLEWRLGTILLG